MLHHHRFTPSERGTALPLETTSGRKVATLQKVTLLKVLPAASAPGSSVLLSHPISLKRASSTQLTMTPPGSSTALVRILKQTLQKESKLERVSSSRSGRILRSMSRCTLLAGNTGRQFLLGFPQLCRCWKNSTQHTRSRFSQHTGATVLVV